MRKWRLAVFGPLRARLLALQSRAKIHHVFYLLAAFDIAAVLAVLLLTHVAVGTFGNTLNSHAEWSAVHAQVSALQVLAGRTHAPGSEVFETRNADAAMARVDVAAQDFERALSGIRRSIADHVPEKDDARARTAIDAVDASMADMLAVTRSFLYQHAVGNLDAARASVAARDRRHGELLAGIDAAGRVLRGIEAESARKELKNIEDFRKLEKAVAG